MIEKYFQSRLRLDMMSNLQFTLGRTVSFGCNSIQSYLSAPVAHYSHRCYNQCCFIRRIKNICICHNQSDHFECFSKPHVVLTDKHNKHWEAPEHSWISTYRKYTTTGEGRLLILGEISCDVREHPCVPRRSFP